MFLCKFFLLVIALFAALETAPVQAANMTNEYRPFHGRLIYEQPMGENLCAITFDDGPSNYTPLLLDMLDSYGIRATFFMLGRNVAKLPDVVRRAVNEGHEVESHSYSHPNFRHLGQQSRYDQLSRTDQLLRACGAEPVLFRPPYGEKDDNLVRLAGDMGMRIVTWSHDTEDWKSLPADYSKLPDPRGHIATAGRLRGIFLFHDIHKRTVDDIPRAIEQLKAGGCERFVTVSDYMNDLFNDPEPAMRMTMHRRTPMYETAPQQPYTGSSTAAVDAMRLAASIVADSGDTPSAWGQPVLAAWKGFEQDGITVRPFPRKPIALMAGKNAKEADLGKNMLFRREAGTLRSDKSEPFFRPGSPVVYPSGASSSYVVRSLQPTATAQRTQ